MQGMGCGLACTGLALGSISKCTFLCGYMLSVPSNILAFSIYLQQISLLLCVEMHELINDIFDISEVVFGIKNVCGITLEPVLAEEFIFDLGYCICPPLHQILLN